MGDAYERLAGLRQEGPVTEFIERFELFSAPLGDILDEALMGMFKNGLDEEVKADIHLMKPKSLKELMEYAIELEGRNMVRGKAWEAKRAWSLRSLSTSKWSGIRPPMVYFPSYIESPKSTVSSFNSKALASKEGEGSKNSHSKVSIPITTPSSSSSNNRGVQRLSEAEINRRREMGLCFKCEEKYGPNHKCKGKQL